VTNTAWPLPLPDALGNLLGADDVRDAVKATIDLWSPYYLGVLSQRLAAANRIGGQVDGVIQPPNPLPSFSVFTNEPTHRNLGSGCAADYRVTCPGTVGEPHVEGSGYVRATYRANVAVDVFGTDWQSTADLTSWYEKVVRWCIVQHRALGGIANASKWIGSEYKPVDHTSTRTQGQVMLGFNVAVAETVFVNGPTTIPTTPGPPTDDPTVEFIEISLDKEPISESLSSS
jgi:hypothetical protein